MAPTESGFPGFSTSSNNSLPYPSAIISKQIPSWSPISVTTPLNTVFKLLGSFPAPILMCNLVPGLILTLLPIKLTSSYVLTAVKSLLTYLPATAYKSVLIKEGLAILNTAISTGLSSLLQTNEKSLIPSNSK